MKEQLFFRLIVLLFAGFIGPVSAAAHSVDVCINFGCKKQQKVALQVKDWQGLKQLFTSSPKTAAEERERIATAIGWLETWVGKETGTWADKARNNGAGEPGQLDCIAESTNSDRYLRLLAQQDWLRFHRVKPRVKRAPFFFDSHWSAVIETLDGKESFAVDSWFFANGTPASLIPLDDWFRKQDPD
jgi:hypothetical protein